MFHLFVYVHLLSFQDSPGYLLAPPQSWFPCGRHGWTTALWKLPTLPGRPLCRRDMPVLQLPRGPWRPVRQMWTAHQRCRAQGEDTQLNLWSISLVDRGDARDIVAGYNNTTHMFCMGIDQKTSFKQRPESKSLIPYFTIKAFRHFTFCYSCYSCVK